jgi:uncharacterized membrane protein
MKLRIIKSLAFISVAIFLSALGGYDKHLFSFLILGLGSIGTALLIDNLFDTFFDEQKRTDRYTLYLAKKEPLALASLYLVFLRKSGNQFINKIVAEEKAENKRYILTLNMTEETIEEGGRKDG